VDGEFVENQLRRSSSVPADQEFPMRHPMLAALLAMLTCTAARPVRALSHCADTAAAIQIALTDAEDNDDDDLIRIVAGTYAPSSGLTFNSSEHHVLAIHGGYSANCTFVTGATTTIDGNDDFLPLSILNQNGAVSVDHLTFVNGKTTIYDGGGLHIQTATGDVRVDRCTFIGNRSDSSGGGLGVFATGGDVRVRNSLAFANSASNGGAMSIVVTNDGDAYLVGNTMVVNFADSDTATAGLTIGGDAYFLLSNNILWNNNPGASPAGVDFGAVVPTAQHSRVHNDIGTIHGGTVGDFIIAEQHVDPQFLPCSGFLCFNFGLAPSSPLVDAGVDERPAA
jgi:hypothetical protein